MAENTRKLKVGMIGVGGYGGYRRQTMRESGLYEILTAYNRSKEPLIAAQKEDGARPVDSYEELLDTPGIEAVFICTGAKFHAEQTLAAIKRKLHVFVEKPLCSTPEEMRMLIEAQKQAGVVVGVGHHDHSCEASARLVKERIDSGSLGKIVAVEATTCHSGGLIIKPGDWRGDPEKNPGGMLFQCGVHKIHELLYYFGPVKRVSSFMRYDANPNTKTADAAVCLLEFASGMVGTLNAYHITPYRHVINIYGSKTNIYIDEANKDGRGLMEQSLPPQLNGAVETATPVQLTGKDDRLGAVRSFYNAVVSGSTMYPSLVDGARAVAVVFAAEESAKKGGIPVEVPSIG